MVAPVFRESAFIWACVSLTVVCVLAALVVRHQKFLLGFLERFIKLPPSAKTVIVTAVVVATVFAQKPGNVTTDSHGLAQVEQVDTAHTEARSHGEGGEWVSTNLHESTQISIRENPCQSVDKSPDELRASASPCEKIVSSNDVVRGYRLETVRTNKAVSYARPANARLVGTWHLTDAYRGRVKVELPRSPHFSTFPLFHPSTSCWAHTWGKVRPQLWNASNEIVVIGAPMFARHDQSYLWTAATANGSVLLTWENFFLGNPYERKETTDCHGLTRIGDEKPTALNTEKFEERRHGEENATPCLSNSVTSVLSAAGISAREEIRVNPCQSVVHPAINAQLELFPNGDFIARSNEVERIYRRVNPDDWDDDGIPNEKDDAPLVAAHEPQFGPHQTLPEGANTNHYYWVEAISPSANARLTFEGNLPSHLPDPDFIAKADETNRVALLIGKDYAIRSQLPVAVVGQSDVEIEVWTEDGLTHVRWPLTLEFVDVDLAEAPACAARRSRAAGTGGKKPRIDPPRAGGGSFRWPDNFCCYQFAPDGTPLFMCDGTCGCGGCSTGDITYEVGGCSFSYGGFHCGCSHESPPDRPTHPGEGEPDHEPQGPSVSATFSASAIVFEDEYENAPGETVARRSTETEAEFSVYGGTKGGSYSFELRDGGRLERAGGSFLPREGKVEAGETFKIKVKYNARSASGGAGDIKAVATFTEEESEEKIMSEASLTAVKVEIQPISVASGNQSEWRHKYGIRELINCRTVPKAANVSWNVKGGGKMQEDSTYLCPLDAESNPLEVVCGGVSYTPSILVVEPSGVRALNPGVVTYGLSSLSAGGIGLQLDIQVLPLDVSFQEIWVEEVPSTMGVQTGYFTHSYFDGDRCHSRENGAGVWFRVLDENIIDARDTAACTQPYPRMTPGGQLSESLSVGWIAGENVWCIPLGWNVPQTTDGAEPWKCFAADETQTFTIDEFGTAGVRKLRHEAVREVLGSVYLDGVKLW